MVSSCNCQAAQASQRDQCTYLPILIKDTREPSDRSPRTTHQIQNREKKPTSYFVYLILCEDGSYYTGYTSNLSSRLERHEKGRGARYTRIRRPKRIVHLEEFRTRRAAMRRERQIKTLTHDQKRDLARTAKRMKSKSVRAGYRRKTPFRVT